MNELLKMIFQMQMGGSQQGQIPMGEMPGFNGNKNALRSLLRMQIPYMNRNTIPNSNDVDMYY